jgi:hypothetical protein
VNVQELGGSPAFAPTEDVKTGEAHSDLDAMPEQPRGTTAQPDVCSLHSEGSENGLLQPDAIPQYIAESHSGMAALFPASEEDWRSLVASRRAQEQASRLSGGHGCGNGGVLSECTEAPARLNLASEASASEDGYQELLRYHRQQRAFERLHRGRP